MLNVSFRTGTATNSPLIYVRDVGFYITDIDGLNGGNNYADRVSLSPQPNTAAPIEQVRDTNINAAVSGGGNARVSIRGIGTDGDPWRLANVNNQDVGEAQSYNNIAETSTGTRVRVDYEDSIARSLAAADAQVLDERHGNDLPPDVHHQHHVQGPPYLLRLRRRLSLDRLHVSARRTLGGCPPVHGCVRRSFRPRLACGGVDG